ncbi:MAG: hypothetical protein IJK99_05780 [Bacteroidales bacterium]|nr:hypothetical protein [Bacteroidales bacterium]
MKKIFNLFSASLSKVHWTFFTFAVLCTVAMIGGCKGGGTPAEPDEATATEAATDTTAVWQATDTDTFNVDEWERLAGKMRGGDTLLAEEWSFLFQNIDKADGEYSEDMGYSLYKCIQNIRFLENMEQEGLDKLSPERREQALAWMIELMSIDIMADEHTYTWAEFSNDFYVFRGSRAAEKVFEWINKEKEEESNQ